MPEGRGFRPRVFGEPLLFYGGGFSLQNERIINMDKIKSWVEDHKKLIAYIAAGAVLICALTDEGAKDSTPEWAKTVLVTR